MNTDNKDVSSLLEGLEPKTEYAEFKALWPDISAARDRKVSMKAIYEQLVSNNALSVSYVTFTRFVKKMNEEDDFSGGKKKMPTPSSKDTGSSHSQVPSDSPPVETGDRSGKVVTAASIALEETRSAHRAKDYSKLAKKN
jgi:hypothetical protein